MRRSRTARNERVRKRMRNRYVLVALLVVATAAIAGFALTLSSPASDSQPDTRKAAVETSTAVYTRGSEATGQAAPAESIPTAVEVPDVTGRTVDEARLLLGAAGFDVAFVEAGDPVSGGEARLVVSQEPAAGTLLGAGQGVKVTIPPAAASDAVVSPSVKGAVVVIDPGHQSRSDTGQEPVGPGSSTTKQRVTGGATGVETRMPEYEIVLQISMNLKSRLEAAGVTVVMVRTTNDVRISNAERARMANDAKADLFVRVHADGNPNSEVSGISTLYPAVNQWTTRIAPESRRAAEIVQRKVIATTGAQDRGIVARDDLTGFNWSQVPVFLIECGFLSNPVEDRLLASPAYQDKLAEGMSAGIIEFLASRP